MRIPFDRIRTYADSHPLKFAGWVALSVLGACIFIGLLTWREYYSGVVGRSFQTVREFTPGWQVIAVSVTSALMGLGLHWLLVTMRPQTVGTTGHPRNELSIYAIYGIGGAVLAFILVWVFALMQSPLAMQRDIANQNVRDVAAIGDRLDDSIAKSRVYAAQIEQLTIENAALQKGAPVLTDPQARIAAIREEFLAHANRAPQKDSFTKEAAAEWFVVAYQMKEQTLAYESDLHLANFSDDDWTYGALLEAVGDFRAIAANITEEDLRDNTPEGR